MSSAKLNFIKLILTNLNDLIQRDPRHVYGYSIFRYLKSKQLDCFGLMKGGLILWSHDAYEHVCVCLSQDSARACVYDCYRLVT